tara:strand:- start:838 stop:1233 length:396 start_codon:yes stop_codon:yes gene_type:complete
MASPETVQILKELHSIANPDRVNDEKDRGAVMEAQFDYFRALKQLAQQDPQLEQRIPEYINNNFEIANDASSMGIKNLKKFLDERGEETLQQIAQEADARQIQQMQMERQHQQQQQMMAQIPQQMAQGQLG